MSTCDSVEKDKTLTNTLQDIVINVFKTACENDENSPFVSEVMLDPVNNENVLKNDYKKAANYFENDESLTNSDSGITSSTTSPLVLYLHPKNPDNEENSLNDQQDNSVLLNQNQQDKRPYMCNICDKTFKRRNHYNVHLHTHKTERPYVCKTCNKAFTHHYFLKRHEDIHTTEKQYTCSYCNKIFSVRRYYTRHVRTHNRKTYECDACDFKCCWLKESVTHVKSHDGPIFTCNKCDRCFTQEINLNLHSCYKSDEKRFSCKFCPKTFRRITNLYPHMAVHENKKSFTCNICTRGFNTKHSLNSHIQIRHEEENVEKPYLCQVCEKRFHLEVNLKRHEKDHQKKMEMKVNPPSLLSDIDSVPIQEFQSRVNRTHSGAVAAYLNIDSPVSEQKLIYFIPGKNINYVCNICLKGFQYQDSLKVHYRRHTGDKPFKCTFCSWRFADPCDLRRHYRVHIADPKYSCKNCNKNFTRKASVTAHLRICPNRGTVPEIASVFSLNEESA